METGDQFAGKIPQERPGKNPVVRAALEDRNVSQNPQIGLPCRRGQAPGDGAFEQTDCGVLHPELEGFLDDHGGPDQSEGITRDRADKNGNSAARQIERFGSRAGRIRKISGKLSARDRPAWWLLGTRVGSTTGKHSHVAGSLPPD